MVNALLFYVRAIYNTFLRVLIIIALSQYSLRKSMGEWAEQMLDYIKTHSNTIVKYFAIDIELKINSSLTALRVWLHICGHFERPIFVGIFRYARFGCQLQWNPA